MIGTAVGDDLRGHALAKQLQEWGVQGEVRFTKEYKTPLEVNVSDSKGARTYFWQRTPEILNTLDTADLSLIEGSKILYADWYDGEHVLRAMDEANRQGVPVFVNLEHGHKDPEIMKQYARRATFCQAVTDAAQIGGKHPDRHYYPGKRRLSGLEWARECTRFRPARQSRGCVRRRGNVFCRVYLWLSQRLYSGRICPVWDGCGDPQGDTCRFADVPVGADP
jgi:sugar/nucleoside kinase (ribokinase family)